MRNYLIVGAGGFFGAIARYAVNILVVKIWPYEFPLGTFLINVSGSFIIGLFMTYAIERSSLDPAWRLLIVTGFLGAYTTFSTFEYETQRLVETGALRWALLNILASVVVGYLAVQTGTTLARGLSRA